WRGGPPEPLEAPALGSPMPSTSGLTVGGVAVAGSSAIVAASGAGHPMLWIGTGRRPAHWRTLAPPGSPPPADLGAVAVAVSATTVLTALRGSSGSQLWLADLG